MAITLGVAALVALSGLAAVLYALVNRRRSMLLAIAAVFVALAAGGGAWYAWVESQSTAWTLAYGAVLALSLVAFFRQFFIGKEQP
jgi:hypothetical protein